MRAPCFGTPRSARLALALAIVSACGCSTIEKTPLAGLVASNDAPAIERVRGKPYTPSTEAVGAQLDVDEKRVLGLGLVPLPAYTDHANRVLARLKTASGVAGVPGQVYLLAKDELDAASTADGNIFLALGWVQSLRSEDELAALLGHELAHVLLRHHDTDLVSRLQKQFQGFMRVGMQTVVDLQSRAANAALPESQQAALRKLDWMIQLTDEVVSPAWTRRQEAEADALGVDLLLAAGYSHTGFSDFLATIADWESRQAEVNRQREQALNAELASLGSAGRFDTAMQKAVDAQVAELRARLAVRHEGAEKRQDDLVAYFERFHAGLPRVARREEPYEQLLADPRVDPVLDSYRHVFESQQLLRENRRDEALRLLQPLFRSQSAFTRHAAPNYQMYLALQGTRREREGLEHLRRAFDAPEPSWKPFAVSAMQSIRSRDLARLDSIVADARGRFRDTPALLPELVGLYRAAGQKAKVDELMLRCSVVNVAYRDQCRARASGSI